MLFVGKEFTPNLLTLDKDKIKANTCRKHFLTLG